MAICWSSIVQPSQIIIGLQTVVSRNVNLAKRTVVSVGQINAGVRSNIVPVSNDDRHH
jgi:metal-dependent amidase/aminoacylase/carboxypeptidase family protein